MELHLSILYPHYVFIITLFYWLLCSVSCTDTHCVMLTAQRTVHVIQHYSVSVASICFFGYNMQRRVHTTTILETLNYTVYITDHILTERQLNYFVHLVI